ncbi:MAG TPA: hypothetical protein PKD45_07875 [Flavobacteriales bacterium]|nr:hypothetical protein [Flavobacteriales bacterium]
MKRAIIILAALGLALQASAQKREYLEDKDEIQRRAIGQMAAALQPEGVLYKAVMKEHLTGSYDLQISFGDKGEMLSVQVLERRGGDIPSQNRFRQLVHELRLNGFKTPKGKQYRIVQTFDLDALLLNNQNNNQQ